MAAAAMNYAEGIGICERVSNDRTETPDLIMACRPFYNKYAPGMVAVGTAYLKAVLLIT